MLLAAAAAAAAAILRCVALSVVALLTLRHFEDYYFFRYADLIC